MYRSQNPLSVSSNVVYLLQEIDGKSRHLKEEASDAMKSLRVCAYLHMITSLSQLTYDTWKSI